MINAREIRRFLKKFDKLTHLIIFQEVWLKIPSFQDCTFSRGTQPEVCFMKSVGGFYERFWEVAAAYGGEGGSACSGLRAYHLLGGVSNPRKRPYSTCPV
jgi:hypothetical protein